jgi:hypothetical protein
MGANKPGKPDASKIAEHSRAIFREGLVSPTTALDALHQIKDNLRREHNLADCELAPIAELIAELGKGG